MTEKYFAAGKHLIEQTFSCEKLTIAPGAELTAPAGQYLVLTVNGAVLAVQPGEYQGDVTVSAAAYYVEPPYPSANRSDPIELEAALTVQDGQIVQAQSVPAALYGGTITGSRAEGFYLGADRENFAGIIVDGSTDYTVSDARMEIDGMGLNDFVGMGAGVAALGDSHVTIENSEIHLSAVTRCAVHAGGKSVVTVNNCNLSNRSPAAELGRWSWGISVRGSNRLCQLADDAEVHYNNCTLTTNGWGVLSVDGSNYAKMFVKDCRLTMTGPRSHGYGIFCIGPTPIEIDHTSVDVNGFPIMMMGMERKGRVTVQNGSLLTGRRYGIHLTSDTGGKVQILDSAVKTASSAIVAKNSNTDILLRNAEVQAGNGVILQMMDTDDPGLAGDFIDISMYETMEDVPIPGRDLTKADPQTDLFVTIENSSLTGSLFNSSTNLPEKASKVTPAGVPKRPGIVPPGRLAGSIPDPDAMGPGGGPGGPGGPGGGPGGPGGMPGGPGGGPGGPGGPMPGGAPGGPMPEGFPPMDGGDMPPMMGGTPKPKNLQVTLRASTLTGAVSAARQHYRAGLQYIEETTREELCNVTQEAAPPVNNGVIVRLEDGAVWNPVGVSYLTALTLDESSTISGTVLVDGVQAAPGAGTYTGNIVVK